MLARIALALAGMAGHFTSAAAENRSAPPVIAEDGNTKNGVSNIGFMKNPPKALKEKFPMCDVFLKVEWINKEEKVGLVHYEAIMKTKDDKFKGRKDVWAFVDMKAAFQIGLEVSEFKRKGELKEILELVKNGKRTSKPDLTFEYKGKVMTFWEHLNLRNYVEHYPLLSDHTRTVCVPYPDEQRAWIIEGRSVKNAYSEERRAELYKQIQETGSRMTMASFELQRVLDVNFDGVDDYLYGDVGVISYLGKLYKIKVWIEIPGSNINTYTFPPNKHTCHVNWHMNSEVVTDGKSYYLGDQCNLTELTSTAR